MKRLTLTRSGLIIAFLLLLALVSGTVLAQDANTCASFAEAVLRQLALNCANLDSNRVCYGSELVTVSYAGAIPVSSGDFTRPSDRLSLLDVAAVQTSSVSLDSQTWGIAVLNVQGNLPLNVPLPGLVFVMVGDVELANGVGDASLLRALVKPLAVTISDDIDLYSTPSANGVQPAAKITHSTGSILQIDGVTPDGQWLRIAEAVGPYPVMWANAEDVWDNQTTLEAPATAMQGLPAVDPISRGPMQTFFLRTGIEAPPCGAIPPSLLYVQTPDNVVVDITVNGVSLRVEGAVILRLVPDGSAPSGLALRIFVPSGMTVLYAGTANETRLPPAFALQIPLEFDQAGRLVIFDALTTITAVGAAELDVLAALEGLPENLLNSPAYIPSVITPSGVGQADPVYSFDDPERALARTRELCESGSLPARVCNVLLAAAGG